MKKILVLLMTLIVSIGLFAKENTEVYNAICDGDLEKVKKILNTKSKIDTSIGTVMPLELASYCYGGHPAIVAYFLDKGADVKLHQSGYTALMWAIRSIRGELKTNNMREQALRMIKMGVDVNYQDPTTGRTALMGAAEKGDTEMLKMLLAKKAKKDFRTKSDWCISGKQVSCTAADHARMGGFVEIALQLEGKSAKEYKKSLNYMIRTGKTKNVESLIKKFDVNAKEELTDLTALHYAVDKNDIEVAKALLKAGANPNIPNYAGITPLRDAVVYYRIEMAKALIDGGAKANNEQKQGCGGGLSEFGWAIEYGVTEVAKYMIENGAIDFDNPGTAFISIYGRNEDNIEIAELLISKGAKPTLADIQRLEQIRDSNTFLKHTQAVIDVLKKAMDKGSEEDASLKVSNIEGSRFQIMTSPKFKSRSVDNTNKIKRFQTLYNIKKNGDLSSQTSRDPIP